MSSNNSSAGFTFIEMAAVLIIAGIVLVGAARIAIPLIKSARMIETNQKLENIAKAIDYYARQNYRLPCPATPNSAATNPPFGFERGSGATGSDIPANCGALVTDWEGIVPFKTLNIPEDWVKDAWGGYITYAISPNFSQDTSNPLLPVHRRCRTADWQVANQVYEPATQAAGGVNILGARNAMKARFCCSGAMIGNDIDVRDVNDQPHIAFTRQTSPSSYKAAHILYPDPTDPSEPPGPNVQVPASDRVAAPVYILVSHGSNGHGAYTGNGGVRVALTGATPAERENANADRRFYDIPPIDRAGAERDFDDVTLWRTQNAIFASGGESCSLP